MNVMNQDVTSYARSQPVIVKQDWSCGDMKMETFAMMSQPGQVFVTVADAALEQPLGRHN